MTRAQVLKRANKWVKHRVPYSQSRRHGGYRQDCSGFVSMAWALGRSYTTRSLPSVGRRIANHKVRPGDAVVWPGRHAVIFGGWKNRKAKTFIAYEEPTWGKVARKRVVKMSRGAKVLRRPGIREVVAKRPVRKKTATATTSVRTAIKTGDRPIASTTPSPTVIAASSVPAETVLPQ